MTRAERNLRIMVAAALLATTAGVITTTWWLATVSGLVLGLSGVLLVAAHAERRRWR